MVKKFLLRFKKAKVISENSSGELEESIKFVIEKLASNINFNNILEIGSRDGFDAYRLSKLLKVSDHQIFIVEANPSCFKFIKKTYPSYNIINKAVYNIEKLLSFNYVYKENIGTSSLLDRNDNYYEDKSRKIIVSSITGSNVLKYFKIDEVSFCKIDVEGATYEVLQSFGDNLSLIKMIHLECEHVEIWKNQKLYSDIKILLELNGFVQYFFEFVGGVERQSDSIWINKKTLASE